MHDTRYEIGDHDGKMEDHDVNVGEPVGLGGNHALTSCIWYLVSCITHPVAPNTRRHA